MTRSILSSRPFREFRLHRHQVHDLSSSEFRSEGRRIDPGLLRVSCQNDETFVADCGGVTIPVRTDTRAYLKKCRRKVKEDLFVVHANIQRNISEFTGKNDRTL